MGDHLESEFKLRASAPIEVGAVDAALRAVGPPCRAAESRAQVDTYLDDAAASLARAGVALRVREGQGRRVLTCKAQGEVRGGLHVRREVEAPWQGAAPPLRAAELPASLRPLIEPETGERPLAPIVTLHVHREVRVLTEAGHDVCELAVDSVRATAEGREATFQEVELEVLASPEISARLADELRARLPLAFATEDKPTHAAALLAIPRPRG
jgi:inorganic triphosphatase YgiF